MSVAILRQGDYLVASMQSDLSDSGVIALRHELAELVGGHRARAIVLTARLRGAETVIVGIQPDVAIPMVQFRLNLQPLRVALDLDAAVTLLDRLTQGAAEDGG